MCTVNIFALLKNFCLISFYRQIGETLSTLQFARRAKMIKNKVPKIDLHIYGVHICLYVSDSQPFHQLSYTYNYRPITFF